jgi:methionyl-tRNA formyltransferase
VPSPPAEPRRLAYLGSPQIAVRPLQALVDAGYPVAAVVTGRPKRRGRGGALSPTPVGAAAEQLGLPVLHESADLIGGGFDLGVVVAYGRLLKPPLLAEVPLVNLHFSLLPRWRGAAPVERALLAGDAETGVCLMEVVEALDAGGVYRCAATPIGPDDDAEDLRTRLVELGIEQLLDSLAHGFGDPEPQQGPSTYADKITRRDLRLDWAEDAEQLHRVVRVGGAWTTLGGLELKVWAAKVQPAGPSVHGEDTSRAGEAGRVEVSRHGPPTVVCGKGALELQQVQPAGKPRVDGESWARGLQHAAVLGT